MITAEEVRHLLHYDPETGIFTWRNTKNRRLIGLRAGRTSIALGYRTIKIGGAEYYEHRLAFLYMTGEWPARVDHINGIKDNNRWANLRECSHSMNMRNSKLRASNKTTGMTGVHERKRDGKFIAQITREGKTEHIGVFDTPEEGRDAYVARRAALFPGERWAA